MRNYGGPREPALEDSRQAKPVTGSESDTRKPVADDGGGEEADYRVQTKIHSLISDDKPARAWNAALLPS